MKTLTAILMHFGVTVLQAVALTEFYDKAHPGGILANVAIQAGAQAALTALNAAISVKNSRSDPNGQPLVETSPDHFQTEHK